jgi:cell pole-organizing protein PopZ
MSAEAQDQSMEEILQSIKRIIADEGDEAEAAMTNTDTAAPLDLTEMVEDDGTVTKIDTADEAPAQSLPDTSALDAIMTDAAATAETAPAAEEIPAPAPAAAPAPDEALISEAALAASASALKELSGEAPAPVAAAPVNSPAFRSGTTVEDLAMEALKPMLKEWLDANLPGIVERLVKKEIRRITDQ